ncbi:predicted protein [Naegleria gruberi]|uniref:Predicted protein n=1 Tax=Naegleria gruberi TaxID=5762 RepID=D2VGJ1_NAEGR|nr:uncharacterized protein NAEGRDRAFT_49356 [Naegleria gruberi]EFC43973.1 predicted protein [Naegleria gruberi]|eukprot:XP_002676717.1 predicted protein [Naegleria gruberi strain NEG-M]
MSPRTISRANKMLPIGMKCVEKMHLLHYKDKKLENARSSNKQSSSYIGSANALNELSSTIVDKVAERVLAFLTSSIHPFSGLSRTIAFDFNSGYVMRDPNSILPYFFKRSLVYSPSSIGFHFYNEAYSYFNITYFYSGVPVQSFTTYHQPFNYPGLVHYLASPINGSIIGLIANQTTPFKQYTQSYWISSEKYFAKFNTDSIYGDPYTVVNSSTCIFYASKLYNPVEFAVNGTKSALIGLAKINISLLSIQNFLKTITMIGDGYVLVSELNDLVIGGSINTTALNFYSRVSMFQLIDRDSGTLMSELAQKYGNLSSVPNTGAIHFASKGVDYFISRRSFYLENISWNVFLIVYKSDVEKVSNINTAISVGVCVGVILLGLVMSALLGHWITKPLRYLERQFNQIKTFSLENVEFRSSSFGEMNRIYKHLYEMVLFLNEFKPYLPASLFNQIREKTQETPKEVEQSNSNMAQSMAMTEKSSALRSSISNDSSKHERKGTINELFRKGLFKKKVSVIMIEICKDSNHDYSDIENQFSKVITLISSITKKVHADLQVLSVHTFQLSFSDNNSSNNRRHNLLAIECGLKIGRLLTSINVQYYMALSGGEVLAGNLGTKALRYYGIVGPVMANVQHVLQVAKSLKCEILSDAFSLHEHSAKTRIVARPVSKEELSHGVETIYQVLKENIVEQDGKYYFSKYYSLNVKNRMAL